MSSRIMSMTRRGRINLERYKSVKFLYFANDYLAVRGDGKDFYLCRVLEDVPENKGSFNIAWLDRVDTEKQHYEVITGIILLSCLCSRATLTSYIRQEEKNQETKCKMSHYSEVYGKLQSIL